MNLLKTLPPLHSASLKWLQDAGYLPLEIAPDQYKWHVYEHDTENGVEEEVLYTPTCVSWAQAGTVRRVFKFEDRDDRIDQALLTWFPNERDQDASEDCRPSIQRHRSRALVILMGRTAHVYFSNGPSNIVNFPFEVEKAFATPKGLVLQRLVPRSPSSVSTPQIPRAPPNSFRSSQTPQWSHHGWNQKQTRVTKGGTPLSLADFETIPGVAQSDGLPRLFTLTDPLAEVGLVVDSGSHTASPRASRLHAARDNAMLSEHDEVLYMSSCDEIAAGSGDTLLLMLTLDRQRRLFRLWTSTYLETLPLSSVRKARKSGPDATARKKRRSSFNPRSSAGSAPPTPLARMQRQRPKRESGVNRASLLGLPPQDADADEIEGGNFSTIEESFGEILKQDLPANRRTSSMMARAELSSQEQHTINDVVRNPSGGHSSFRGHGGATTSFASHSNRDSLGKGRLSGRLSAAASMLRLGEVEELTTIDSAGDDTLLDFLSLEDSPSSYDLAVGGLKRELVLTCISAVPMTEEIRSNQFALLEPSSTSGFFTTATQWRSGPGQRREKTITVHFMHHDAQMLCELSCRISENQPDPVRDMQTGHAGPSKFQILQEEVRLHLHENISAALAIRDGPDARLLVAKGKELALDVFPNLNPQGQVRFLPVLKTHEDTVFRNLRSLGAARFCEWTAGADFPHFGLVLRPRCHMVSAALKTLQASLELVHPNAASLEDLWLSRFALLPDASETAEWQAMTEAVLFLTLSTFKSAGVEPASWTGLDADASRASAQSGIISPWSWARAKTKLSSSLVPSSPNFHTDAVSIAVRLQSQNVLQSQGNLHECLNLAFLGFDARVARPVRAARIILSLLSALHIFHQEALLNVATNAMDCHTMVELMRTICIWAQWPDWMGEHAQSTVDLDRKALRELRPAWTARSLREALDEIGQPLSSEDLTLFKRDPAIEESSNNLSVTAGDLLKRINRATSVHTKRTAIAVEFNKASKIRSSGHATILKLFDQRKVSQKDIETFPEGIGSSIKIWCKQAQSDPPDNLTTGMAYLLDRPDIEMNRAAKHFVAASEIVSEVPDGSTDVVKICTDVRAVTESSAKHAAAGRTTGEEAAASMRLIYRLDRRWQEAAKILNPLRVAVATISPKPDSTESQFLEDQKALAELVYKRTMAIPSGQAALNFNAHRPLLTEKIDVKPFNTTCNMQPSNNIVNADKSNFTEEKVSWAFFHAGVNAGLRIARDSPRVDNSWLILNKPNDLGNRHAGFLYALGLNGHLKSMAKWLAFKYLTPKHNMTSIGLLLGLSASHMGTMDSLVTRLLSVHVTRLLPPGAAELNLSPLTQTAGVIGIGLLFYGSQHRRMSEVMLSEIENLGVDDSNDSPNSFRDEGYRLAAGFALGLINLGKGRDLRSLHDMYVVERLLSVATGSRTVDTVHILDQSTPGAVMAYAMIFMKSENRRLADEIGVSKIAKQFDYIRPDALLLRTVASNLIMWSQIEPNLKWMCSKLPSTLSTRRISNVEGLLDSKRPFDSSRIPLYNILAGQCWSIALKCAGGAHAYDKALNILMQLFDKIRLILESEEAKDLDWDELLARDSLLRFEHVLALSMATVAAGTGDLDIFRRLRYLHASVTSEQTFGLHQASHTAMGILFMGHGKFTFNTSDLAVASLLCAFYPLFPKDVLDNRAHLQAMRHFWVYATEPRCLIPRDIETREIVIVPIVVILKSGEERKLEAPGLLPELDSIAEVRTDSAEWWGVRLNFAQNAEHLAAFKSHQTVLLKRKGLLDRCHSMLSVQIATQQLPQHLKDLAWVSSRPQLVSAGIDQAHVTDLLHASIPEALFGVVGNNDTTLLRSMLDPRATGIDDALSLHRDVYSGDVQTLKALRSALIAVSAPETKKSSGWLRQEWIQALRLAVIHRIMSQAGEERHAVEQDVVMTDR